MLTRQDTIVAVSTAPGRGAIAIVRLTGPLTLAIARAITTPGLGTERAATRASIHAPGAPGEPIDRGLVTWFQEPRSYTGEDLVEFAVHGGAMVPALVVEACVRAGARPALPGEFTERAVFHHKLDLVQAEAVADLIDARTRAAHRAAVQQLDGALSRRLDAIRDAMLQVDALIAYDIDFPAEDDAPPTRARVVAACDDALAQLERLLATLPAAALGREGALVVLAGPPNAGKSALLNALVGEARVIVSDIPGTTRDAVEVLVDDRPYPLRLVDTAGLRASGDTLERMGIEVSERYLAQAHVVLACAETNEALERTLQGVSGKTRGAVLPVATKADVRTEPPAQRDLTPHGARRAAWPAPVAVSAATGEGLDALREAIRSALRDQAAPPPEETPLVTRARHEAALRRAAEELRAFRFAWDEATLPAPVAATHLRAAVIALESLIGAVDVEDVLERVFRTFCVGK
jgi:tRNA modification GTPase